ncbi:MAG: transcriptional repressor [Leptospiraceae bacterium]|nr:transcriptional repressor [Leptospiraceae bacterium]MCB1306156.1 transcriptional repressor [Leptospiraceae bacterium]
MNGKYGLNKREIADLLRDKDINPTTQRIEIAHLLFEKPQHLSAEEIRQRMNSEYEKCSQATVYNTLRLFVEKAVVRELIFSSDRIYYDSNIDKHHHFVDVDSGQIYDLPAHLLSTPDLKGSGLEGAEIMETSIIVRGKMNCEAGAGLDKQGCCRSSQRSSLKSRKPSPGES